MERGNPLSAAAFCSVSLYENVIHIFKKGTKFEKNVLLCFTVFRASFRLSFSRCSLPKAPILVFLGLTWNLQKRICHLCFILPGRCGVWEVRGHGEWGVN